MEIKEIPRILERVESLEHTDKEESIVNHESTGIHGSTDIFGSQQSQSNIANTGSQGILVKYETQKRGEGSLMCVVTCKKILNQIVDCNNRRITRDLIANRNIAVVPIVSRRIIEYITPYVRLYVARTEQIAVTGVVGKLLDDYNDGKEE